MTCLDLSLHNRRPCLHRGWLGALGAARQAMARRIDDEVPSMQGDDLGSVRDADHCRAGQPLLQQLVHAPFRRRVKRRAGLVEEEPVWATTSASTSAYLHARPNSSSGLKLDKGVFLA